MPPSSGFFEPISTFRLAIDRFQLRNLALPTRLALAAFLVTVGVGYVTALVQLHFQHASPGNLLPTGEDAVEVFHGKSNVSQMERLLSADEGKAFNGSGSMRQTFTTRSAGWSGAINKRANKGNLSLAKAEAELRAERDGERVALLSWIRQGADQQAFDDNSYSLPTRITKRTITPEFVEDGPEGTKRVKIASIMEKRCTRCHNENVGGSAAQFPLDTWEDIHVYCEVKTTVGGMSIPKLAQTTHAHLLGFAMLYGLTGVIFTLTSYPSWMRATLGVLPLVAQVLDIGCWWLARLDPMFAHAIVVTGGLVATGLVLQISLSLFNMFGRIGKTVLLALMLATVGSGIALKTLVLDPYLAKEKLSGVFHD